ncbi:MAG: DUF885 domain-containing protein [Actinomycetaceae bacterium]|nr:DUF885 domain-containing protein [Actinomycetaceae bacterium]
MANSHIDELSNRYFEQMLRLSPERATVVGVRHVDQGTWSDYSPEGIEALREAASSTLAQLETLEADGEDDDVAAAALRERLSLNIELVDAGQLTGALNVIDSPIQAIRDTFDLMPTATDDDWATIGRRLAAIPEALDGYRRALAWRLGSGPRPALRQVVKCAEQCDVVAGEDSPFSHLVAGREELDEACRAARAAYGELAEYLRREIAPAASEVDAVGREQYELASRVFLGARVDLDETYEWGLAELASIKAEQEDVARQLYGPGVSVAEACERLTADAQRKLYGTDALREWMQTTADGAMDAMGAYFDIPEPMRTIECCIAPSGTGGIYYTPPTDDFSRPGRMWWSVPAGVTEFTTWQEKTTVFHEGVPGHHLQLGLAIALKDRLNDWRRHDCWVSGHGEGWALYSEQLMRELGFMDEPGEYMGLLDGMRLRATRVVLDIGLHLGKATDEGGTWDADYAWRFLCDNVAMDRSFLAFEFDRYLGWPGQAPSYKIGQRIWNELRDDARRAAGADFDLKAWHMKALSIGSVGLDVLRQALA